MSIVEKLVAAGHSIWTIACCQHSYACYDNFYNVDEQRVPPLTGLIVAQAIEKFVFDNERVILVDEGPGPRTKSALFD
jgi:hypothetical protein